MIVNKVVLLISTTRAGEEELISEIRGCCLCLATLSPQRLTAERVALAFMLPIQPVPWVSDPVRHPFSLLSWCPEAESLSFSRLQPEPMLLLTGFTSHDAHAGGCRLIVLHL